MLGFVGGTGAAGFGAFGLARVSAVATAGVAHVRDALESLTLSQVFPLADLAAALWNGLFRPSPGDLHIPMPGNDGQYFTPTGVRRTVLNSAIERAVNALNQIANTVDPFRSRGAWRSMDPSHDTIPRMRPGSSDPNDVSEVVGIAAFYLADIIFTQALLFGGGFATGQVSAPPARSSVDPLAATPPGPQRSPLATTLPPQRSPLATTLPPQRNPLASTLPPESAPVGFADTQPAPVPGPVPPNTAPPAQPGAIPPGESPYDGDPD
jgi:hypothetical protein